MALAGATLPYASIAAHSRRTTASSKHSHRLLSSLHAVSGDPAAADRLIRKFVASSSKSTALQTLSHLLPHPSFAISVSPNPSPTPPPPPNDFLLQMYERISEAPWFRFHPKLAATIAALLEKSGDFSAAEALISDSVSRLEGTRDLNLFYCTLIESSSQHGLKRRVLDSFAALTASPLPGRRKAYESMVKALCSLELPQDAEEKVAEMAANGLRPSVFEFRLVARAYGRMGEFDDMRRVLGDMEKVGGYPLGTVCANMVLSCYGDHGELPRMVAWIKEMRAASGVSFSIRTFNSVLNSCPGMVSMVKDLESLPVSIGAVVDKLLLDSSDEAELVRELLENGPEVLSEVLEEWKLDLHGCHLGSAYLVLLMWVEEMRARFAVLGEENVALPAEVSVVCGSGKHSSVRGESPVRAMVSKVMFRIGSPMRMDRRNKGRFVAKGKTLRDWFCSDDAGFKNTVPVSL